MLHIATNELILSTWEHAYGLGPAGKGLTLLALALPNLSLNELKELTVGRRDAELLSLRSELFGQELVSIATCPACDERIEIHFNVDDIRADVSRHESGEVTVELDGVEVAARIPTCGDLIVVERLEDEADRRQELLRRCTRAVSGGAALVKFTAANAQAVSNELSVLEPQADVRITIECPSCQHESSSRFDIVMYLWNELDVWSRRILSEVHTLGRAYGWTERQILGMSTWRRQLYLEMLRQ
jgi:hypothetical protein